MDREQDARWAAEEFAAVNLGDKRLDARLVTLCDRFSDSPESPINQACADWAETRTAYRFFRNEHVDADQIPAAHRRKTSQHARAHNTVPAIQDICYQPNRVGELRAQHAHDMAPGRDVPRPDPALAGKLRHQMRRNEFTDLTKYGTLTPGWLDWHRTTSFGGKKEPHNRSGADDADEPCA